MEAIISAAIVFFFLVNFPMFLTAWYEEWDRRCIKVISIIDFFFVLLVCIGLYLISVL